MATEFTREQFLGPCLVLTDDQKVDGSPELDKKIIAFRDKKLNPPRRPFREVLSELFPFNMLIAARRRIRRFTYIPIIRDGNEIL